MIQANDVHGTLKRHQLADGLPIVMDLEKSHGSWLHDARTGQDHLDFFTCFASWPVGYNHPMLHEPAFQQRMLAAATNNPSNSDLYTAFMAEFVEAFATRVTPKGFPYHFWVAGGALAVENAMKAAFDWKAQRIGVERAEDGKHLSVLHFRHAFHGRSGYTMSVTNSDPKKVALYPKFDWPRVHTPRLEFDLDGNVANDVAAEERRSLDEIEAAFKKTPQHIAAILIEPMQGEGGDNHFRPEFLRELRRIADEKDALLLFDEVQTGFFGSGEPWLWQQKGVAPDIVAFGKKTQVCGIYSSTRIDTVEKNVFKQPSRINSTWGGNLADMVRCQRFIEIIEADDLVKNVKARGEQFLTGLRALGKEHGQISNVRGTGSLIAFTLDTPALRDQALKRLQEKRLLALASGERAIRFRLPFVVTGAEIDQALERIAESLRAVTTV